MVAINRQYQITECGNNCGSFPTVRGAEPSLKGLTVTCATVSVEIFIAAVNLIS